MITWRFREGKDDLQKMWMIIRACKATASHFCLVLSLCNRHGVLCVWAAAYFSHATKRASTWNHRLTISKEAALMPANLSGKQASSKYSAFFFAFRKMNSEDSVSSYIQKTSQTEMHMPVRQTRLITLLQDRRCVRTCPHRHVASLLCRCCLRSQKACRRGTPQHPPGWSEIFANKKQKPHIGNREQQWRTGQLLVIKSTVFRRLFLLENDMSREKVSRAKPSSIRKSQTYARVGRTE